MLPKLEPRQSGPSGRRSVEAVKCAGCESDRMRPRLRQGRIAASDGPNRAVEHMTAGRRRPSRRTEGLVLTLTARRSCWIGTASMAVSAWNVC